MSPHLIEEEFDPISHPREAIGQLPAGPMPAHTLHVSSGCPPTGKFPDHIQGVCRYDDKWIFTHNLSGENQHGYFAAFDGKNFIGCWEVAPTSDTTWPHPGGCQIVGNHLAVCTEIPGGSRVLFYDISGLKGPSGAYKAPFRVFPEINRPRRGAGAVGITVCKAKGIFQYLIAVLDGRQVDFHAMSSTFESGDGKIEFLGTQSIAGDVQNLNLIADGDGIPYLCAFRSVQEDPGSDVRWHDSFLLYEVRSDLSLSKPEVVDFGVKSYNHNPRFRFGAGIRVLDSGSAEIYATEREIKGSRSEFEFTFGRVSTATPGPSRPNGGNKRASGMMGGQYLLLSRVSNPTMST
ncbi:hypothetical protein ERC79_11920 [Rhodococcus sp. ABRD24]|uniref:hypothetical protein n=1 Tax=Rhodococcus sp. ABRD24 TaxID=2507582 RepID=UPI00103BFEC1|nr:hypothetical protein [Rhodococcus sp. ABRD24]QBJ96593.1 hypothetical protein ERC79_11920 [Rhodococcus sp. ABRD24]